MPHPHLVGIRIAPCYHAAAGGMRIVPVLHVVLLGHARRTRITDVVVAGEVLHWLRGVAIDEEKAPYLGLVHTSRMPARQRAWLSWQQRNIREDLAGRADQPAACI